MQMTWVTQPELGLGLSMLGWKVEAKDKHPFVLLKMAN